MRRTMRAGSPHRGGCPTLAPPTPFAARGAERHPHGPQTRGHPPLASRSGCSPRSPRGLAAIPDRRERKGLVDDMGGFALAQVRSLDDAASAAGQTQDSAVLGEQFYFFTVVLMWLIHAGFMSYEAGIARRKNVMTTAMKNILTIAVVTP